MGRTFLSLQETHYQPQILEQEIYQLWQSQGVFNRAPNSSKPPFSIAIPPPNVTGRLHMGHALNNSVQDALIRYKRMDGYDALWIPGTDHAGISTQSVVKKHLDAEGINYLTLGREKMIERIWEWKAKYGDQILLQLRRLGCSCDWSITRFTMDEGLSRAVATAFKRLYDDGLIYRGKYIVNWCPVDQTALSDDEVSTAEGGEPGFLWHFRYPLSGSSSYLVIATTRPETMLGDTAVAVNPKDERYQELIGKKVVLPLVGREIPIIADDYVDRSFGSGCLKVTPAHDPNDFQIAQRHGLLLLNVMNADGTMGDAAPQKYCGLDRFECRKQVVEEMQAAGLLEKVEERLTPVGRAQRSGAVIEYRLSDQWFVRMQPLAKKALAASERGEIKLFPERWERIYAEWLTNSRDWCISRQIWWGHRIPAWHHRLTGEIVVGVDTPQVVAENPEDWIEEKDVLDTWFSSALWPFSTLGWPEATADLARYYPTSVLSTAKDIIYFWVARMVMTGVQFLNAVPFKQVYFHPVICDARGETMSKSKGNGIDPLHVIEGASVQELEGPIYEARPSNMQQLLTELHSAHPQGFVGVGADALRITLLSLNSQAQQVQISLQKFQEVGQRFADKLWNAGRFVLRGLEEISTAPAQALQLEDKWILARLDQTVNAVRANLEIYHFNVAIAQLFAFFWDDFCDWYLELSKARLKGSSEERRCVQEVLVEVFSTTLRLFHPFTPFITEELWGHLSEKVGDSRMQHVAEIAPGLLCAVAPFPQSQGREDSALVEKFALYQEIVRSVRQMRANSGVSRLAPLTLYLLPKNKDLEQDLREGASIIAQAAVLQQIAYCSEAPVGKTQAVLEGVELYLNLSEHIDVKAELERNTNALRKIELEIEKASKKLSNTEFMRKAPEAVRQEQARVLAEAEAMKAKLLEIIAQLATR